MRIVNWIFKIDNVAFSEDFKTATISFVQRRNFSGKEGELVLLLDNQVKEWKITNLYKIDKIITERTESNWRAIFIEISLVKKYEEEKILSEYIYSLKRITNFNNPQIHFRGKYNRLNKIDFDVIDKDEIYYTRTILGTIFNSLHKDHQEQYLLYLAENNPSLLSNSGDLSENLNLITEYVKFAILKPAKYLTESDRILSNILKEEELLKIAFKDPDSDSKEIAELIHQQTLLINNNLPLINDNEKYEINMESFLYDENNRKFSSIFKNAGLPFKLK